jgi:hypothetical protein
MKKALLVLLLLAVAGGLFAQVTWAGRVGTGLTATSSSVPGHNDWGLAWDSLDARLNLSYANEAGTYGGNLSIRVGDVFHTYRGWFKMFDGVLKIVGGKWADGEFTEPDYFAPATWVRSNGIAALFYPIDGLRLGFGLQPGTNGSRNARYVAAQAAAPARPAVPGTPEVGGTFYIINKVGTTAAAGTITTVRPEYPAVEGIDYVVVTPGTAADPGTSAQPARDAVDAYYRPYVSTFDNLRYWFGAAYVGENFGAYASASIQSTAAVDTKTQASINDTVGNTSGINVALSGYFDDPAFHVAISAKFNRLDNFALSSYDKDNDGLRSSVGSIALGQFFGYYGIENLDIELTANETFYGNGDGAKVSLDLYLGYAMDVSGIKYIGFDIAADVAGPVTQYGFNAGTAAAPRYYAVNTNLDEKFYPSISFGPDVTFGLGSSTRRLNLSYTGTIGLEEKITYESAFGLSFLWTF